MPPIANPTAIPTGPKRAPIPNPMPAPVKFPIYLILYLDLQVYLINVLIISSGLASIFHKSESMKLDWYKLEIQDHVVFFIEIFIHRLHASVRSLLRCLQIRVASF